MKNPDCFIVYAFDEIIEHVAHPLELLGHLKNFLEPGGRLMLTTPNGSYFRNKLPTYSEVQDFSELETRQFMPDVEGHLFSVDATRAS